MSRAERLLDLIQTLRRHKQPVSGRLLADELGVSLRTIYSDIATLQGQGTPIEGSAGLGYVLQAGFMLPPLMFNEDEVDAVILGLRFVSQCGDEALAKAASDVLAKVEAVLPLEVENASAASGLLAGPSSSAREAEVLSLIRKAIRAEQKISLDYTDKKGRITKRVVWPVSVGFFEVGELFAAWCESRQDFRHFRMDRIKGIRLLPERMPKRHRILLAEWRLAEDLGDLL